MTRARVSTGSIQAPAASGSTMTGPQATSTMLFDGASGSTKSAIVTVQPGQQLILTAFDLIGGSIKVCRVLSASYSMPSGDSNCRAGSIPTTPQAATMNIVDMRTNGVAWMLDENTVSTIISLPGDYQFVLSDDELVGNVMLEMRVISARVEMTPLHQGWRVSGATPSAEEPV